MSINGINHGNNEYSGVYATKNMEMPEQREGVRERSEKYEERISDPAYRLDESEGAQKPYRYRVEKDGQGNVRVVFGERRSAKTEEAQKEERKDAASWAITELIPDPEDPDNIHKAKRRVVARGTGQMPGMDHPEIKGTHRL